MRTETQLVAVDVVVTDKKGNYVRDLTAKDFHVFEDNKEQKLKSFSPATDGAQASDQKRFVVLFFDTTTMSVGETALAQQAAVRFAEAGIDSHRMLAVAAFNGSLRLTQNFTEDLGRLKRALAGVSGSSQFDASNTSLAKTAAENGAREAFSSLRNLARGLSSIPGRKAIIFFTSGYPPSAQRSTELAEAIAASNKSNVAIFPIDVRSASGPTRAPSMPDISETPTTGGRITSIGARGPQQPRGAPTDSATDSFTDTSAATRQLMDTLAEGTGGFILRGTNDPFAGLAKVGQEQTTYYMLGYTPPESSDGSCHKLRVKVDRDGTVVRARSEYCKSKPQDLLSGKPIERELESRAAGSQSGNIAASMQLPFFYTSNNVARVNVAMEITPSALKFEKQKDKFHAAIDILGLAYLADGSVGARFSDTLKLDFDSQKEIDELKQKPLHYENQFEIASGQYSLRVVFSSGGESFGKLEQPLVVEPYDKSQFNFSGLALSKEVRAASDLTLDLDALLVDDRTPLVANGLRIVPDGSNRFKKTDPMTFYAEIYEPSPIAAGLRIRILDRKTSDVIGDSGPMKADTPKAPGMVPLAIKIPIADLPSGSYVLEVQATDTAGKAIKRAADFELE